MTLIWLLPLLLAFVTALLVTPLVRRAARALGVVARPSADRWHEAPTPLLGGVAIYLGFIAGGIGTLLLRDKGHWFGAGGLSAVGAPLVVSRPWIGVFLAATMMFLVGLADDKWDLNPTTKLMLQAAAAAVLISFGVVYPISPWAIVNVLATVFWFLALTNAMNLLDNMDGVAAGIAGIAALFLGITLFWDRADTIAAASLCLTGAAFGFLWYNFPRASIFMGDSGSMFVGSLLAGLGAAYPNRASVSLVSVLFVPAAVVVIPILDTLLVTATRTLAGRSVASGGRDHTSHRLVAMGFSERQTALVLYAVAGMGGMVALTLRALPVAAGMAVAAMFLTGLLVLVAYLSNMHTYTPMSAAPGRVTLLISDLVHKRRALEVAMDLVLFAIAYQCAYLIRWDGRIPDEQAEIFAVTLAIAVAVKSASFAYFGVYRGNWQHLTVSDAQRIAKATLFGTLLTTAALVFGFREYHFGRGVLIIDGMLVGIFTVAARASFRSLDLFRSSLRRSGVPTLIYGAGKAGELALREMMSNSHLELRPVGFLDDDPSKRTRLMHGIPVLGTIADAATLVRRHEIRTVVLGARSIVPENLVRLKEEMAAAGVNLIRLKIEFQPVAIDVPAAQEDAETSPPGVITR